jgi:hypothetical protein
LLIIPQLYKNSEDLTDMVGLAETYVLFANIEILSQVNRLLLAMVRTKTHLFGEHAHHGARLRFHLQLEKEHKLPPEKQNVGRVFLDMVMPMKVYITYFTNYPQACQRLQELKNTKSGLSDFLEVHDTTLHATCGAHFSLTTGLFSRYSERDSIPIVTCKT